jgi:hypothetical protein
MLAYQAWGGHTFGGLGKPVAVHCCHYLGGGPAPIGVLLGSLEQEKRRRYLLSTDEGRFSMMREPLRTMDLGGGDIIETSQSWGNTYMG